MKTFIRIAAILCCVLLITPQLPSGHIYASEAAASKTKKKKSAGKQQTKKQKAAKKSGGRQFEGQLVYVVNTLHDWKVRKLSSGQAYNGESLLSITVKGDFIDIFDKSLQKHSLWNPVKQKGYVYSEVSGQGVELTKEQWEQMYATIDNHTDKNQYDYSFDFAADNTPQTVGGDRCVVYKGQRIIAEKGDTPFDRTDVEMWYADRYRLSPVCRYAFWGIEQHGLLKKGIVSVNTHVSILGNMKSQVDFELKDIVARSVAQAEFALPSGIEFKPIENVGKMNGFYKHLTKALKKQKLYPKTLKAKEVKRAIAENWAFAEELNSRSLKSPKNQTSIWEFGGQILSAIGSIASIWSSKPDEASLSGGGADDDDVAAGRGAEPDVDIADCYYIPDKIQECQRAIRESQDYLAQHDKPKRKPKKMRKMKMNDPIVPGDPNVPRGSRMPTLGQIEAQAKVAARKDIMEDSKIRIQFLKRYSVKHHTDYIPKSEWEALIKRQDKNHKDDFERRKKAQKAHSDKVYSYCYHDYVNMLENAFIFKQDYSMDWVRKCQSSMKELRQKNPKIKKSVWEDWDGVTDPT